MTDKDTPPTLETQAEKTFLDTDRQIAKADIPLSPPPVSMNIVTFIAILLCTCVTLLITIGGSKIWLPYVYPELKTIHQTTQQMEKIQTSLQTIQKSLADEDYSLRIAQLKTDIANIQTILHAELTDIKILLSQQQEPQAEKQQTQFSEKELYEIFVQKLSKKEDLTELYTIASNLDLAEDFADLIQQSHNFDFDKIKSTEEIILSFESLKTTLLSQSQIKPENVANSGLVDRIKGNITITPKGESQRIKLKNDLQMIEDALLQENFSKALTIMSHHAKLHDMSAWLNMIRQRLDFEEFLKQVRNFKGPYKK